MDSKDGGPEVTSEDEEPGLGTSLGLFKWTTFKQCGQELETHGGNYGVMEGQSYCS